MTQAPQRPDSGTATAPSPTTGAALTPLRLGMMATATGIAVANIYYNQPMLGLLERSFGDAGTVGMVPTVTQLGYALGLLLLVPLGDILPRRELIVGQFLLLALALVGAALAPTAVFLLIASFGVGAMATVAQQIVPFAASLAPPDRRGSTVGTVMAGLLAGILLSRALAGLIGASEGWRAMFWLSAPVALLAALVMARVLPRHVPQAQLSYPKALHSLVGLWRQQPALRRATVVQAGIFGSFSVFWTSLALYLASPAFGLGADVAGLFGLLAAGGLVAAPLSGHASDRWGPRVLTMVAAALALAAWLVMAGFSTLWGLAAATLLLDFGSQSALVANQHVIYGLDGAAHNRVNTIFMTGMFLGGALGSALAGFAWAHAGWGGVTLAGGGMAAAALIVTLVTGFSPRRHAA
jgi:predicted MFS family arabinose efflux permease